MPNTTGDNSPSSCYIIKGHRSSVVIPEFSRNLKNKYHGTEGYKKLAFSRCPVMSNAFKPGLGKQWQMGLCEFEARVSQTNKKTTKCFLHKQKHQLWVGWRCSLVGRVLALIHIRLQYCTHWAERSVCTISALGGGGRTPASLRPIWSTLSPRWSELHSKILSQQ